MENSKDTERSLLDCPGCKVRLELIKVDCSGVCAMFAMDLKRVGGLYLDLLDCSWA